MSEVAVSPAAMRHSEHQTPRCPLRLADTHSFPTRIGKPSAAIRWDPVDRRFEGHMALSNWTADWRSPPGGFGGVHPGFVSANPCGPEKE